MILLVLIKNCASINYGLIILDLCGRLFVKICVGL